MSVFYGIYFLIFVCCIFFGEVLDKSVEVEESWVWLVLFFSMGFRLVVCFVILVMFGMREVNLMGWGLIRL